MDTMCVFSLQTHLGGLLRLSSCVLGTKYARGLCDGQNLGVARNFYEVSGESKNSSYRFYLHKPDRSIDTLRAINERYDEGLP
jgi:hypothetical protein